MGTCIEKIAHECGTSNGLQVFVQDDGRVDGYCFSCGTYVRDPYGNRRDGEVEAAVKENNEKEVEETLASIDGYPSLSVAKRRLKGSVLEELGIKTSVSEFDGKTPTALYHPVYKQGKKTGYYVKTLPTKEGEKSFQFAVGDVRNPDPLFWEVAKKSGAYSIVITEGREDAAAVHQLYKMPGANQEYTPAVISLPNGVNSVKSLSKISNELSKFKKIILCFDDDEAGHKATTEAMLLLPDALSVTLPEKDANACILAGKQKAALKALSFSAEKPKNTRIVSASDIHQAAREPTPYGELSYPFPTLNKMLRRCRLGTTIYIGAGVKMGKSELLNHIAAHFISENDVPVFMAKPEENNKHTYKLMCNKMMGKVFHDPDVEFDEKAYDEAGRLLRDKLYMVDLYQHMGWETLKADITYAAKHLGCKAVFIDPITNLTNGMESGEANVKLQAIAQDLSAMAKDLNIVVFIFCHLKAHEGNIGREARRKKYEKGEYIGLGNCPHEFGGDIQSAQFAGSRAMMRSCHLMMGLEGNKDPMLPDEVRDTRILTILEDRDFGNSARIPVKWDRKTTLFQEI